MNCLEEVGGNKAARSYSSPGLAGLHMTEPRCMAAGSTRLGTGCTRMRADLAAL